VNIREIIIMCGRRVEERDNLGKEPVKQNCKRGGKRG
jgi:hypothetical protein